MPQNTRFRREVGIDRVEIAVFELLSKDMINYACKQQANMIGLCT